MHMHKISQKTKCTPVATLGIQSPCQIMIGVYSHLLRKVFRFHYHSQKVIGSLGQVKHWITLFHLVKWKQLSEPFWCCCEQLLFLFSREILPPSKKAGTRHIYQFTYEYQPKKHQNCIIIQPQTKTSSILGSSGAKNRTLGKLPCTVARTGP